MLCSITFTPQGVLTLLLANILEKGDGTDPNRAGYFRIRGPLFHGLRGSDVFQTFYYLFENQYSELVLSADQMSDHHSLIYLYLRGSNPSKSLEPRRSSGVHPFLFPLQT